MTSNRRGDKSNPNYRPSWEKKLKEGFDKTERPYGSTPGQLGEMKGRNFEVAVSSPPFRQREGGSPEPKPGGPITKELYARHSAGNGGAKGYGESDGQLANMGEGSFELALSSPPYSSMQVEKNSKSIDRTKQYEIYKKSGGGQTFEQFCRTQDIHSQGYGNSEGQLANMPAGGADDFWVAARQIVEEVYAALETGGHAVWVVKDYVKNKARVPFCDQWRQLCEAVGFVTVHEHHALLVRNQRVQHTLEGGTVTMQSESKSFFRRLAEKNGSPRIDWETVWCMEKQ